MLLVFLLKYKLHPEPSSFNFFFSYGMAVIILLYYANKYAMNHGCAIMKNNLRTIFDESMGGKPRKQPAISRPVKTSLRPLFLVLFLLTVLSGLAVCVWLAWTYDAQDIYYAWLILVVYSITGTTLFMTI